MLCVQIFFPGLVPSGRVHSLFLIKEHFVSMLWTAVVLCARVCACTHACMHMCACICMCSYMHVFVCVCHLTIYVVREWKIFMQEMCFLGWLIIYIDWTLHFKCSWAFSSLSPDVNKTWFLFLLDGSTLFHEEDFCFTDFVVPELSNAHNNDCSDTGGHR